MAADGDLDLTFSGDGKAVVVWTAGTTTYAEASEVAPLPDGSVVIGGTLIWEDDDGVGFDWALAKFTRSGLLDSGWGENGRRRIAFDLVENGADRLHGIFADPDGSLLLVGTTYDGDMQLPALAKLTPAGDPDPSFGDSGFLWVPSPWANGTAIFVDAIRQRDGKIVLAGSCLRCPSNTTHYNPFAVRLLPDGTLDTTFSFDGWAPISDGGTTNDMVTSVAATADGRVLLAFGADQQPHVARLNWMGGLDSTFGSFGFLDLEPGIGVHETAAMVVDPATDETYLVTNVTIAGGSAGYVDRRRANGADDPTWGVGGGAFISLEEGVELSDAMPQGDGRLVIAGSINANGPQRSGFLLARLDDTGQLDATFHADGLARYEFDRTSNGSDRAHAIALAGGKPVAVGYALDADDESAMAILRVRSNLVFADSFEPGDARDWSRSQP